MKRIASFSVDHNRLLRGLYVSRKDYLKSGEVLTSFDLRFKTPNREAVLEIASMHTIEHLGATWLRNHPHWQERTIYFGPMGCRTGFYLILEGNLSSEDICPLMRELFTSISEWKGEIPGASAIECGNWREHDLETAKKEALCYKKVLETALPQNLNYPE